jgi:hypothetical protein
MLTWPSGMRVIAQGTASPEDLARFQAAAAALSGGSTGGAGHP